MNIIDLGKQYKKKHPGAYDDLSDAEVGRLAKAKRPWKYRNVDDEITEDANVKNATVGRVTRIPPPTLEQPVQSVQQNIPFDDLWEFFNPQQGILKSRLMSLKAEEQNRLLSVLNQNLRLLVERWLVMQQASTTQQRMASETQAFVFANQQQLYLAQLQMERAIEAHNNGYSLDDWEAKRREEERLERLLREQRGLKEIEVEAERKKAELAKDMARAKMMPELLQLEELHTRLSATFKEIEQAHALEEGYFKTAEIERLGDKAEYFREQIQALREKTPRRKQNFKFDDDEDV